MTFKQMKEFAKQCVEHNNSLNDTQKEIVKLGIDLCENMDELIQYAFSLHFVL